MAQQLSALAALPEDTDSVPTWKLTTVYNSNKF